MPIRPEGYRDSLFRGNVRIPLLRRVRLILRAFVSRRKPPDLDRPLPPTPPPCYIEHLPYEVMEEIMFLASTCYSVFSTNTGPWAFRSVSRFWFDICSSSPRIWSDICCKPPRSLTFKMADTLRRALSYSGNVLLSIYVLCPAITERGFDKERAVKQIFSLLRPCSGRWKALRMYIPVEVCLARCLRGLRSNVAELRSLSISMHGQKRDAGDIEKRIKAFQFAPKLHTVTLTGMHPSTEFILPQRVTNGIYTCS